MAVYIHSMQLLDPDPQQWPGEPAPRHLAQQWPEVRQHEQRILSLAYLPSVALSSARNSTTPLAARLHPQPTLHPIRDVVDAGEAIASFRQVARGEITCAGFEGILKDTSSLRRLFESILEAADILAVTPASLAKPSQYTSKPAAAFESLRRP
jgi:hypothetical protein